MSPAFFEVLRGDKEISEDFSVFIRRFDVFEDKKVFTLGDLLRTLPEGTNPLSLYLFGCVFFKDMIRGWIPDEKTIIFECERSMREYKESQKIFPRVRKFFLRIIQRCLTMVGNIKN